MSIFVGLGFGFGFEMSTRCIRRISRWFNQTVSVEDAHLRMILQEQSQYLKREEILKMQREQLELEKEVLLLKKQKHIPKQLQL